MKKKLIALTLAVALTATACGNSSSAPAEQPAETTAAAEEEAPAAADEAPAADEAAADDEAAAADDGATVEITIPSDFYEDVEITQEALDKEAAEIEGLTYVLNDDKSVTCTMTKEAQAEKLKATETTLKEQMKQFADDSENYPTISKVEANADYTEFKITTTAANADELDVAEAMAFVSVTISAGMYQIFEGIPYEDCEVNVIFVNEETGEEFEAPL